MCAPYNAAAGGISSLLYSPVDLVVIQQQKLGLNSPMATIQSITSNHGVAGLMRGFSACVVREVGACFYSCELFFFFLNSI